MRYQLTIKPIYWPISGPSQNHDNKIDFYFVADKSINYSAKTFAKPDPAIIYVSVTVSYSLNVPGIIVTPKSFLKIDPRLYAKSS